jgi:hypothetical protein
MGSVRTLREMQTKIQFNVLETGSKLISYNTQYKHDPVFMMGEEPNPVAFNFDLLAKIIEAPESNNREERVG